MRAHSLFLLCIAGGLAACSGTLPPGTPDAGTPTACRLADGGAPRFGLNDVSLLLPLPNEGQAPLAAAGDLGRDGQPLIPRGLYDGLVHSRELGIDLLTDAYKKFIVVAVRFDLCDREAAGPCPDGNPVLRLVLQPVQHQVADDAALHAFYEVPRAERAALLEELAQLAALQGEPTTSPLQVNPALKRDPNGPYARRLQALLLRSCGAGNLLRLTFFAQPELFAAIVWEFRGVERRGTQYLPITIPHTQADTQVVRLGASMDISNVVDVPQGFSPSLLPSRFADAGQAEREQMFSALAEINNPKTRGTDTLQCAACHVSTFLLFDRLGRASRNLDSLTTRYQAPFDLSLDGGLSASTEVSIRAFGYFFESPAISARVVNESAQVLLELEQCTSL